MKILKSDLKSAADEKLITPMQVDDLWHYLASLKSRRVAPYLLDLWYYIGGVLILASMSWFLTKAWSNGLAIMALSSGFCVLYLSVGNILWRKENFKVPAGLLITASVSLVPLFIYGLQRYMEVWPVNASFSFATAGGVPETSRIYKELGAVLAALIALRFYKCSLLALPLMLSLWCLSMDAIPFFVKDATWANIEKASMLFGCVAFVLSYIIDLKSRKIDIAFWGYLFSAATFWGGLSLMYRGSELGYFLYFLCNVGFVICAIYLRRSIFAILGAVGIVIYVMHLAFDVFEDSYMFSILLALIGLAIMGLGVLYQGNKHKIEVVFERFPSSFLSKWRPEKRG